MRGVGDDGQYTFRDGMVGLDWISGASTSSSPLILGGEAGGPWANRDDLVHVES